MTSPPPTAAVGNATLATACSTRGCQLENAQRRIAELEQRAHDLAQSNVQFEATANDALAHAEAAEARNAQHLGAIEVWQREAQSAMQCAETAEELLAQADAVISFGELDQKTSATNYILWRMEA